MALYSMTISLDELLKPSIDRIKNELRQELEKRALEIVNQEVAKFVIDLSQLVHVADMGKEIVITVRKEVINK